METYYEIKPGLLLKSAIALGFFDGVHLGHQVVIGNAVKEARRLGLTPGVVTFRDHPRTLTQGIAPLLLTVIEQRLALFQELGVEAALVLSFNEELCQLSPEEYVENVLVKSMGAKFISVGYNHHFGKDRGGSPALLSILGKEFDFSVRVAETVYCDDMEVSSSKIRDNLTSRNLPLVTRLLSRPYALYGQVIRGQGQGRKLGFPTANLSVYEFQLVPPPGVYVGTASVEGALNLPAVINVGYRPTFTDTNPISVLMPTEHIAESDRNQKKNSILTVEAHILDFGDNLYDKHLNLSFHAYLRPEQKFPSIEALRTQIERDCHAAGKWLIANQDDKVSKGRQNERAHLA